MSIFLDKLIEDANDKLTKEADVRRKARNKKKSERRARRGKK